MMEPIKTMATRLLYLLLIFSTGQLFAQFGPQQIISTDAYLARRVIPFDVDQDGYVDVISGSYDGGKLAWYRNLDGLGNFGDEQIISTTALVLQSLELYDLDSDGDQDLMYHTSYGDKIVWFENLDGLGNYGTEQIIISDLGSLHGAYAADIDGDQDLDIIANQFDGFFNDILWLENTDGQGNFSAPVILVDDIAIAAQNIATDLDNDGDLDIVTAYGGGAHKIVWYANNGSASFGPEQLIYQFDFFSDWTRVHQIAAADLSNDGNMDIMISSVYDDFRAISWIKQIGSEQNFTPPIGIEGINNSLGSLRSYDLDDDGDNDVLVSFNFSSGNSVAWYENTDGQGSLSNRKTITTETLRANDARAADLDQDGDLDIVSASSIDGKIAWYENDETFGIFDYQFQKIIISPNPSSGVFKINSDAEIKHVDIRTSIGTRIDVIKNGNSLDLSNVESGVYFVRITDPQDSIKVFKVIKY